MYLTSDLFTRHTLDHIWNSVFRLGFVKDIQVLENVQKATTNLVPKLRKYSYPDRLKTIGITSLKELGHLIEKFSLID